LVSCKEQSWILNIATLKLPPGMETESQGKGERLEKLQKVHPTVKELAKGEKLGEWTEKFRRRSGEQVGTRDFCSIGLQNTH